MGLYEYVKGNPIIYLDPAGESVVIIVGAGAAIVTVTAISKYSDWGTDWLADEQGAPVKKLLDGLIKCGDKRIKAKLQAMTIVEKFESGTLDSDDDTETRTRPSICT